MSTPHRAPLPEGPFDLAVIGGGINGAGIARDAVLRGMTVCLLEKGDFAGGATGRTSKMVHGGIRYLETLRLGLVFEALRERALLLSVAPHLVRPQPFLIPVYRGARRGARAIRAGLLLYDGLALGRRISHARMLSPAEAASLAPGLRTEEMEAAGLYWDAVMDDARLCLANLLDAREAAGGRFHFRSRAEVVDRRGTSPITLRVRDRILGREYTVQSHRVVRAVGPWSDEENRGTPLLLPSKGAHIVLRSRSELSGLPGADGHGILLAHQADGRIVFVIPWKGRTIVGTTETPFQGSPDGLRVEAGEIEYLADAFRRLFPSIRLAPKDLLGAYAGVRPLARAGRLRKDVGCASRRHRIIDDGHGTLTVVGGKYTTFRAMARQVVDRLLPGSACRTARRPLPGGEGGTWEAFRAGAGGAWIERFGEEAVRGLFERHGSLVPEVLGPAEKDPSLAREVAPGVLRAEVRHAVLREEVLYPEDFLARRTSLRLADGQGREAYAAVEEEIRAVLGKEAPPDLDAARERYLGELADEDRMRNVLSVSDLRAPVPAPPRLGAERSGV